MNNNNKFQAREYNGSIIHQREDGFMDATMMAKVFGTTLKDWLQSWQTLRYFIALSKKLDFEIPTEAVEHEFKMKQGNGEDSCRTKLSVSLYPKWFPNLIQVKRGSPEFGGGTWLHRKASIRFAQWLDEDFAVEVDFWVDEGFASSQFQPQSKAGQALRVLDNPRALLELLYGNDICKKLQKLYKNKFQIARFFWVYCYGFLTPEERAKHEQVNPVVNKRRNWRIYQFLDDATVERLHPHVRTLYILIMAAHSKKQLESMLNEAYSQHNQMDLFDLWDFELDEAA